MNASNSGITSREVPGVAELDSVIITLAAGAVLGLILIAQGRTKDNQFTHPMHSPNDRSRFATIRALGDNGTYAIGSIDEDGKPVSGTIIAEDGWDTIDKVRRPDNGLIYSSKPPLLPTILALEYILLRKIPTFSYGKEDGWHRIGHLTFAEHPQAVVRILVVTANWVPLVIFLILFARLLDRLTQDSWIRYFTLAAVSGGTYLSGFSVTLNNHTVAAFCAFFSLYPVVLIWFDNRKEWWLFALAGFFAAFTAVLELPALALVVALLIGLVWNDWVKAVLCFLPFALVPLAGHCYTNYQVTGTLRPAYENKEWYEYKGSYWKVDPVSRRLIGSDPKGIDSQHEPEYVYVFHMLLGHHGVFSLTPIFIISAIGLGRVFAQDSRWMPFALLTIGLSVLLVAFYTIAPIIGMGQRNYGGMCNGMRWLFWLIPFWLLFLPNGLEWKARCPWCRGVALVLLLISSASAFYATRNPWTRPWLHELLYQAGWIQY